VGEAAVHTYREDFDIEGFQLFILDGNCRQFGGSNEGEIPWIEAQNDPMAFVVRQTDVLEAALMIGIGFKIGSWFTDPC
jgi:hypothetical protein